MTPPPDDSHAATDPAEPLSDDQLEIARHVGRQMHHALQLLLNSFRPEDRTAKALATHLGIEGVVARRIVRAANQADDPLKLLTRLPSVENLRKVQRATVKDGITAAISGELLAGVDAFAALVETLGPGKAGLTRRLRATSGAGDDPDDDER